MTEKQHGTYWDDLAEDLKDPDFLREFILETVRIHTIDRLVNQLDDAREDLGMSKAELARAISAEPATIRRLFGSATTSNPTIGTVSELAAPLGLQLALVPIKASERSVPAALRSGSAQNPDDLLDALGRLTDNNGHLIEA